MNLAVIKEPLLPLYKNPSRNSERVDEVLFGMVVNVLDEVNDEWALIETQYKYKGYVEKNFLSYEDSNAWNSSLKHIVTSAFVDVLDKPRIQSEVIFTLLRGSYLIKVDITSDGLWTKIRLPDGNYGWLITENLFEENIPNKLLYSSLRDRLVNTAFKYMNTQYRWGGKTPLGIDCSGLCSMVYLLHGIKIFRDADIVDGFPIKKIPIENMKKADLIFFPGHVAMYIGDYKFIHSSHSCNGVKINSLSKNDLDYREDLAKSIIQVGSIF